MCARPGMQASLDVESGGKRELLFADLLRNRFSLYCSLDGVIPLCLQTLMCISGRFHHFLL
jgi:hypothetical protein